MALQLQVISPVGTLFEGEATSVTLPGTEGEFQVLKGHVNMVASLEAGLIKIDGADGAEEMVTDGGFVEVKDNVVSALIERAFKKEEIDAEEDQAALEKLLNKPTSSDAESVEKLAEIQRHRARIRLATQ